MKDPSKLISPKAMPAKMRTALQDAIRAEPKTAYTELAERFGVSKATVSRLAAGMGIRRASEKRSMQMEARAMPGTRREGGIVANDEQWAARQHRIGGC